MPADLNGQHFSIQPPHAQISGGFPMKVVITTSWVGRYVDMFRDAFPEVEFVTGDTPEEVIAAGAGAEAAFGPVDQQLLDGLTSLKWIQSASAGVEWMRRAPGLPATDITVTNTRGAHASTIAEHAFGMLVHLARRFDELYEAQKRHAWIRGADLPFTGLAGLTLGIVGLGNIGRAIAKRGAAFEMTVIAVDAHPVTKPDYVAELGLLDGLDDLLAQADVVIVTVPITPETRGMIGARELGLLKDSAIFMVVSRGGIVDEPALIETLTSGKLLGAGLDVAATEPLPADDPLWDAPRLFITPHCSPTSRQTHANVMNMMQTNLRHFLAGEPLENVVNKSLGY